MNAKRWAMGASLAVALGVASTPAHAVYPVIDAAAIKQLVVQVNYWKQQITAMRDELNQLQQTHAALTGGRGMEGLLPLKDADRNYLPRDWTEMTDVLAGQSAAYAALAGRVSATVKSREVLTPGDLAGLTPAERDSVLEARRSAAGLAVMTQQAYAEAGARFASLATLVAAIGGAADAKAIADLQGRITAEEAMLANEQAKLAVLYQAAEADRWLREQQLRELAIAGHGDFATRLRPVTP